MYTALEIIWQLKTQHSTQDWARLLFFRIFFRDPCGSYVDHILFVMFTLIWQVMNVSQTYYTVYAYITYTSSYLPLMYTLIHFPFCSCLRVCTEGFRTRKQQFTEAKYAHQEMARRVNRTHSPPPRSLAATGSIKSAGEAGGESFLPDKWSGTGVYLTDYRLALCQCDSIPALHLLRVQSHLPPWVP